jgi:hypothetical protein
MKSLHEIKGLAHGQNNARMSIVVDNNRKTPESPWQNARATQNINFPPSKKISVESRRDSVRMLGSDMSI